MSTIWNKAKKPSSIFYEIAFICSNPNLISFILILRAPIEVIVIVRGWPSRQYFFILNVLRVERNCIRGVLDFNEKAFGAVRNYQTSCKGLCLEKVREGRIGFGFILKQVCCVKRWGCCEIIERVLCLGNFVFQKAHFEKLLFLIFSN